MATATIRPGLLVGLHTSARGGITYEHLDRQTLDDKREQWTTRKNVLDPVEQKRAEQVRSKARSLITSVCSATPFGYICPLAAEPQLDAAVRAAHELAREFNATSTFTKVSVNTIKGHIASTDEEAAQAIGQNIAELVEEMNAAIQRLDPEAVRAAANKAREMEALLEEEQAKLVVAAVKQARTAARTIVKRIQNEGEAAAIVLKDISTGAIEKARFAFLDLSDDAPADPQLALPQVDLQRFAGLGDDEAVQ